METFVVVGGGISGMYAAMKLKMISKSREVFLVETQPRIGGLLSEVNAATTPFDTGVHTFYETGIEELDRDLYNVVPLGGWIDLIGTKRDLGGAYYNGSMHFGNAYLGFHGLPAAETKVLEKDFLSVNQNQPITATNAADYLIQRFGPEISTRFLFPLVEKFAGKNAREVHKNVASILPISRINLFSELVDSRELAGDFFNSRLAFSDQRNLPSELIPNRKAYYPKMYGTQRYVDAFEEKLQTLGVKILTSSQLESIRESSLTISGYGEITFDMLIWTPNPITFSQFSNLDTPAKPLKSTQKTAIVSYLLNREPNMKDLYYGYSLDPKHLTHRFSSPFTFCPNSKVGDFYRFTNEIVFHAELELEQIRQRSTDELVSMGIFQREWVAHSSVTLIKGGYPDLSYSLINDTLSRIDKIKENAPSKIEFRGVMSKPDLFFQNDVLVSTYNLVTAL